MVTSLFKYDCIRTTDTKAKALRAWADHLVTLAKRGDLHARRQALAIVREKNVVHKLFAEAADRYGSVSGGYTRIVKLGPRPGDCAPMSQIELMAREKSTSLKKPAKKDTASAQKPAPAEEKKAQPESGNEQSVQNAGASSDEPDKTPDLTADTKTEEQTAGEITAEIRKDS